MRRGRVWRTPAVRPGVFAPRRRTPPASRPGFAKSRLQIKTKQQLLIADVQLPVGDDRMRPQSAAGPALVGFLRQFEPALFAPAVGRRLDQRHDAALLAATIEIAVSVSH